MKPFPFRLFVLALLAFQLSAWAHSPAEDMTLAAKNFLDALTPEQGAKTSFDFKVDERTNWHFIPRARQGLSMKEMTPAQRQLAHALLNSAMSHRGYIKATTIMTLEQILLEIEQGRGPTRDPELYFVSIFGKPGDPKSWGWRFEGRHLSLNFTIVNGKQVSVTPSFFGTNPAEVKSGPRKGLRVLADEEDLARKLVRSLNEGQRKIAIYTDVAPRDIITGADRHARFLEPAGLPASKLSKDQSQLLWGLIKEYVYRYRSEVASQDLEKIEKAGLDRIYFAWAGPLDPGHGHYYRVQGPTFLMEYDNTQNDANHIHAVWRDLQNDFGEDLLKKHYEQTPH